MFGRIIGTNIAVDWFQGITKNGMFFISESQIIEPVPDHVDRLYTSIHNARLLRSQYQLPPDRIVGLPLNERLLIQDKVKKLNFYVTLLDARQIPGAVMYLFEGEEIGNILYAGRCCYFDNCIGRPLSSFLKSKVLDYLYVHDACTDCHNHSMSTSAAVEYTVDIIRRKSPSKVIIHEPYFREDILAELRAKYGKPICVSENVMKHLEEKGRGADFTLDREATQVYVTHLPYEQRSCRSKNILRIGLIPCSMNRSTEVIKEKLIKLKNKGYRVVLYRNHCSPPELVSFVNAIGAKHTVLLRPQLPGPPCDERSKDLNFWAHLGNFNIFIEFFNALQNETEKSMEVCDVGTVDAEITPQSSVDCIAIIEKVKELEKKDCIVVGDEEMRLDSGSANIDNSKNHSVSDSLILIESDIVSLVSKETILNAGVN